MTMLEDAPPQRAAAHEHPVDIGLIHLGCEATPESQEERLLAAGCTSFLRIADYASGRKQLDRGLAGLKAGSRVHVTGLEAFGRSLAEILRTVRGLVEMGVEVRVNEEQASMAISSRDEVAEALRALASFASAHRSPPMTAGRRPRTASLSEVQIKYARKLFSEGEPLRTIGLIMRASPDEVWQAISKHPRGGKG